MIQGLKNYLYDISSSQNVWNATLEFLSYGTERKAKKIYKYVILRCTLYSDTLRINVKISIVGLLQIVYFYFCRVLFELIYIWESYRKNKKVNFFETQCRLFCAFVTSFLNVVINLIIM